LSLVTSQGNKATRAEYTATHDRTENGFTKEILEQAMADMERMGNNYQRLLRELELQKEHVCQDEQQGEQSQASQQDELLNKEIVKANEHQYEETQQEETVNISAPTTETIDNASDGHKRKARAERLWVLLEGLCRVVALSLTVIALILLASVAWNSRLELEAWALRFSMGGEFEELDDSSKHEMTMWVHDRKQSRTWR
jgi:hypothetical protein